MFPPIPRSHEQLSGFGVRPAQNAQGIRQSQKRDQSLGINGERVSNPLDRQWKLVTALRSRRQCHTPKIFRSAPKQIMWCDLRAGLLPSCNSACHEVCIALGLSDQAGSKIV
jgi:hypothetical protein